MILYHTSDRIIKKPDIHARENYKKVSASYEEEFAKALDAMDAE